ncbi:MAG: hypothetical protein ACWGPR_08585 [Candidatus Deferrimicrobiaceae bacterium]
MATRASRNLDKTTTFVRTVETSQTVAVGRLVKDGNADYECQHAAANEAGIGIVIAIGGNPEVTAGAAGDFVTIAALDGGIIPVLVGTGGATRGTPCVAVATGLTDATLNAAGSTYSFSPGRFAESGSAGDIVGLIPQPAPVILT